MARKSVTVERVQQRIDEDLLTDLTQDPSQIRRWFVDNVFRRSLSYLVGFDGDTKARILRCTTSGLLKTAPTTTGLEDYTVKTGTGADTYTAGNTYTFTVGYSRWDILIEDNDAVISWSDEAGTWGGDVILTLGWHSIDLVKWGIRIKNRTAAANTTYQIVAFK